MVVVCLRLRWAFVIHEEEGLVLSAIARQVNWTTQASSELVQTKWRDIPTIEEIARIQFGYFGEIHTVHRGNSLVPDAVTAETRATA